jgi:hypothetical protein
MQRAGIWMKDEGWIESLWWTSHRSGAGGRRADGLGIGAGVMQDF